MVGAAVLARQTAGDRVFDLVVVLVLAVLIVTPFLVSRARQKRRVEEAREARFPVAAGHVRLVFHTYTGFLVFIRTTRHVEVVRADAAEARLRQLVRQNLTYCWLTPGALYVPLLTWIEYRQQMTRVRAAMQGFPVRQINR